MSGTSARMSTRVLIISSRPDIMAMATESLEASGFAVTGSLRPDEAMNILVSNDFDAVVIGGGVPTSARERLILEIRLMKPGIAVVQPSDPDLVVQAIDAALTAQMS